MMKSIILLFIIFPASIVAVTVYDCPRGKLTKPERKKIVGQNNGYRSDLIHGRLKNKDGAFMPRGKNMMKLKWSCKLEYSAQRWADQCVFEHSPKYQREGIGENVYMYRSSGSVAGLKKIAGTVAGRSWWSELPRLYLNNPSNVLTWKVAGQGVLHFTQMAWGKTYKIGCGVATHCDGGRKLIVICHYSPGGNTVGRLIYEKGPPCKTDKDCRTGKCSLKSGLCRK